MAPVDRLQVEVLFCPAPNVCDRSSLFLSPGASVADALHASGLHLRHGAALDGLRVGVWNKVKTLDTPLRDGDRVEVYRALTVDPKEARRQRYAQHKASLAARKKPPQGPARAE
jgi:uncharacterized protein